MGTFLITKRKNDEFQFVLKAGNGEVLSLKQKVIQPRQTATTELNQSEEIRKMIQNLKKKKPKMAEPILI